jgi:hypothetical protein
MLLTNIKLWKTQQDRSLHDRNETLTHSLGKGDHIEKHSFLVENTLDIEALLLQSADSPGQEP